MLESNARSASSSGYIARICAVETLLLSETAAESIPHRLLLEDACLGFVSADDEARELRAHAVRFFSTTAIYFGLVQDSGRVLARRHGVFEGGIWTHKVDPAAFA